MSDPTENAGTQEPAAADPGSVTEPAIDVPVDASALVDATEQPLTAPDQPVEISEDAVVALIAQRDEYLEALQRLKAEFANHRRRSEEQASNQRAQAAADLVSKLLPVLDSAQAALDQGVDEVKPLSDALFDVLTGQGLESMDPVGELFDPERHEAVMFESGEGDQTVVETLRLGYTWNQRVLRAAMVKVRG